jgi:hypothetical protein
MVASQFNKEASFNTEAIKMSQKNEKRNYMSFFFY